MRDLHSDELFLGMKTAMQEVPAQPLSQAAECLHAALEILEEKGFSKQASQLLSAMEKIGQAKKHHPTVKLPTMEALMREGISQRDFMEADKGNPTALAKFYLVLRRMGMPDHEIARLMGPKAVMSEQTAKDLLNPNRALGKIWEWTQNPSVPIDPDKIQPGDSVQIKSLAQKIDHATQGLTPDKMVDNLKDHGTEFNLAGDRFMPPPRRGRLSKDDLEPDLAGLFDEPSFDLDASDDELLGLEIHDDDLSVTDGEAETSDFEDERHNP
jgi:hypothetical protein